MISQKVTGSVVSGGPETPFSGSYVAWKRPDVTSLSLKLWARSREERKTLFYFNGNLGPAYEHGRPEDTYSVGTRQKLAEEFGSAQNKEGKDVIVIANPSESYHLDMASSVFCGVLQKGRKVLEGGDLIAKMVT